MGKKWIVVLLSIGIILLSACGYTGNERIAINVKDAAKQYEWCATRQVDK